MTRSPRPFHPADVAPCLAAGDLAAPGAGFRVGEWTDPGNPRGESFPIAPVHIHWGDDESWYVLDGALSVLLHDTVVTLEPGGAVTAVRGTRHTYWNPSASPCRYLIVAQPRVFALIEALHDTADPAQTFEAFNSEFLGWELPRTLDRLA